MFKIAYHPYYKLPLPEGHRFPMEKYELLPQQLRYEGVCSEDNFFIPELCDKKTILLTHDRNYYDHLEHLTLDDKSVRKIGFPLSDQLLKRERYICQGTIDAALFALKHGIAANIAGGTHHAFRDRGEGFCIFNDNAVATNFLLQRGLAKRILIVDLDVHQGNGTASIFKENENVFTFSMHGGKNYPFHKEQSDLDIELEDGTGDKEYLKKLQEHLPQIINKFEPDFIFYQCGVDILASDKMGRLNCTMNGAKERDRMVMENALKNKIPLVFDMGGGYSEDIKIIVEAHANTFRLAQELFF